jgi:hypothetical protein
MNRQAWTKEISGILVAILFLALGFLAVWSMHAMQITAGDAVFVALLLVPFITYVILTGRVSEFKAPGGLEAKFVAMAAKPAVDFASQRVEFVEEEMRAVSKSGLEELARLERLVDGSKRIVLKLTVDQKQYDKQDALTYIERFLRYRNFRHVVFIDQKGGFVAWIAPWAMYRILAGDQGDQFIDIINKGSIKLRAFPGVMTTTISTTATNIQALQQMTDQNLEAILLLDKDNKVVSVVEREQVLSKLMLGMVS